MVLEYGYKILYNYIDCRTHIIHWVNAVPTYFMLYYLYIYIYVYYSRLYSYRLVYSKLLYKI